MPPSFLDIETFRKWHTLILNTIIELETSKHVELLDKSICSKGSWLEEKLKANINAYINKLGVRI
jgi:hypothetical protein